MHDIPGDPDALGRAAGVADPDALEHAREAVGRVTDAQERCGGPTANGTRRSGAAAADVLDSGETCGAERGLVDPERGDLREALGVVDAA